MLECMSIKIMSRQFFIFVTFSLFTSGAKKKRKSDGKREKSRACSEFVQYFAAQISCHSHSFKQINLHSKIQQTLCSIIAPFGCNYKTSFCPLAWRDSQTVAIHKLSWTTVNLNMTFQGEV